MADESPKGPKRMTRELSFAQDQAPSEEEDEGYALKHTVTPKFTVVKTKINKDINLLVTRNKLQQDYEGKAEEGRRMRKNDDQMDILVAEWARSSKWTYKDKIRIAAQVGLTYHQVAKWNWDYNQKHGVPTKRVKKTDK